MTECNLRQVISHVNDQTNKPDHKTWIVPASSRSAACAGHFLLLYSLALAYLKLLGGVVGLRSKQRICCRQSDEELVSRRLTELLHTKYISNAMTHKLRMKT